MRFASFALALAMLAAPHVALAQDSVKADEQILIKRAVYAQNLGLTDDESKAFWPIYDEYEAAMKKVTDARLELLDQYAARYDALTDADAKDMLATRNKLDTEAFTLRQKYAKKVQQAIPSVKALRYVQLQDRIDNVIAGNLYTLIPIAR
jgi:hypothetical protein